MNTQQMIDAALKLAGLNAPTLDTAIGCEGENIRRVACGIDMDSGALLAAKTMGYDCVAEHHGIMGRAVRIGDQMEKDQMMRMYEFGVPINVAQKAIEKRAQRETDAFHSKNLNNKSDLARFIGMPYVGIHTPADLIGQNLVQARMDALNADKPFATVADVIAALMEFPEYQHALQRPAVRVGSERSYAGRICVMFAGCTGGGPAVYKTFFDYGVGTLIMMHIAEDHVPVLIEHNKGNIVIAGHMASDSIGFNRILSAWEQAGLECTRMGGIVR